MFIDYVGGDFPESRPHAKYASMRLGVVYKTTNCEKSNQKNKWQKKKIKKKNSGEKEKESFVTDFTYIISG